MLVAIPYTEHMGYMKEKAVKYKDELFGGGRSWLRIESYINR